MDFVSHALWGATIIRKKPEVWWAALFGALPDLLTAVYGFFKTKKNYFKYLKDIAENERPNESYFKVYYFFHSFIPISVIALIILIIKPALVIITIPYYLHIIMDIFMHRGVWATRIFYPLSNFHFQGKNWWQHKWIIIFNWAALIVTNLIIFLFKWHTK